MPAERNVQRTCGWGRWPLDQPLDGLAENGQRRQPHYHCRRCQMKVEEHWFDGRSLPANSRIPIGSSRVLPNG